MIDRMCLQAECYASKVKLTLTCILEHEQLNPRMVRLNTWTSFQLDFMACGRVFSCCTFSKKLITTEAVPEVFWWQNSKEKDMIAVATSTADTELEESDDPYGGFTQDNGFIENSKMKET